MEEDRKQPLLSWKEEDDQKVVETISSDDIAQITGVKDFYREFVVESRKLWYLAGPAIFTYVCQYSLGAVTQAFAGQFGTLELAAFSVQNSVITTFACGILLGMGSALETLCGQAYGAKQIDKLGLYMQRSWVILIGTTFVLMFINIFATPLLKLIGQTSEISEAAGTLAIWMIPQLYASAIAFPVTKFLQAQSKIMVLAWIAAAAMVFHTFFSWLIMFKLGWGIIGGAVVLNLSWWFIAVAQLVYMFSGTCGKAWSGFSWEAFSNLSGFFRLSLASAVMLCLEIWYFMTLILFAGYLKNAETAVDTLSICMSILGWVGMISLGFNAAISVRVSNELGAAHPRTAKFSIVVVVLSVFIINLIFAAILLGFRKQYPTLFSNSEEVKSIVVMLTPLLAGCLVINNIQPVLSGVAIGAGWQAVVAYVNIVCYYALGLPLGLILGYTFDMGVQGIWMGMSLGTVVQTLVLFLMIYRTNWNKEASAAEERIKKWGGDSSADIEK